MEKQQFDLIEEITRNDGTKYYELGNVTHNSLAEVAVIKGFIKEVRILKLNIPKSRHVLALENYINEHYEMPSWEPTEWVEWKRNDEMENELKMILRDNQLG